MGGEIASTAKIAAATAGGSTHRSQRTGRPYAMGGASDQSSDHLESASANLVDG
jgi:hypothetical protein